MWPVCRPCFCSFLAGVGGLGGHGVPTNHLGAPGHPALPCPGGCRLPSTWKMLAPYGVLQAFSRLSFPVLTNQRPGEGRAGGVPGGRKQRQPRAGLSLSLGHPCSHEGGTPQGARSGFEKGEPPGEGCRIKSGMSSYIRVSGKSQITFSTEAPRASSFILCSLRAWDTLTLKNKPSDF